MSQNIIASLVGNKLTIIIDTSVDLGASKSGKTDIVATSRGAIAIGKDLQLNLNLYRKRKGG